MFVHKARQEILASAHERHRLINATLNDELFFSIANHMLTVVDVDAFYVKPDVPRRELLHEGKVCWYTTR